MRRAVDALAAHCRVITFSLADEPSSGRTFDPSKGLQNYVEQIETALDTLNISRAAICGISFGGRIAARFAATHAERTSALVLCSTPGPGWTPVRPVLWSMSWPRLMTPWFFATAPRRVRSEIARALPGLVDRAAFSGDQLRSLVFCPLSPVRMARRARLIDASVNADCADISAPTLLVNGEPSLDRIVPVGGALEFANMIADTHAVTLPSTGHLGCITRPGEFARIVADFLARTANRHAA